MRHFLPALILAAAAWPATGADTPTAVSMDTVEHQVSADPENLKIAAEYRQLAIAGRQFDRAIDVFERLAKAKGSHPNALINLALAYVDKVPVTSDVGRLRLGREAMSVLTESIDQRPSLLAYYIRGVVNLYFNNLIFHRIPRGIADLQQALTLADARTPGAVVARVYVSLGDGYWRLGEPDKARAAWAAGLARCAGCADLQRRTGGNQQNIIDAVSDALDSRNRVDTSLRELFADR